MLCTCSVAIYGVSDLLWKFACAVELMARKIVRAVVSSVRAVYPYLPVPSFTDIDATEWDRQTLQFQQN